MNITIREAFAKAGYPVPGETRILVRSDHTGTGFYAVRPDCTWRAFSDGWHQSHGLFFPAGLDLSNLPAQDAYDVLPPVVRAVVGDARTVKGGEKTG